MTVTRQILIVDDDADALVVLSRPLLHCGYVVTQTTSSKQALDLVRRQHFDLVLLDLSMPEPDGFEVLQHVRSEISQLKVIMISGFHQGILLPVGERLGAVAAMRKPIDSELLISTVEGVLKSN